MTRPTKNVNKNEGDDEKGGREEAFKTPEKPTRDELKKKTPEKLLKPNKPIPIDEALNRKLQLSGPGSGMSRAVLTNDQIKQIRNILEGCSTDEENKRYGEKVIDYVQTIIEERDRMWMQALTEMESTLRGFLGTASNYLDTIPTLKEELEESQ